MKYKKQYLIILFMICTIYATGCSSEEQMQETMGQLGTTVILPENPDNKDEIIEIPDEDVPKADLPDIVLPPTEPETPKEPDDDHFHVSTPECQHEWKDIYTQVCIKEAWTEQKLIKDAWTEQILTKAAWTETKLIKNAWDEKIVIKAAWTETIQIPEQTKRIEYVLCGCGYKAYSENKAEIHTLWKLFNPDEAKKHCTSWNCRETIETIPAKTETIYHPAEYQTIHHDAIYETINHPAQYKEIYHEAQYQTIHHDAIYEPKLEKTICTKCNKTKTP